MGHRWLVIIGLTACAHAQPVASTPTTVVQVHSFAVNFVPFGAGQFQNRHRGKGFAFAVAEGTTAAMSLGVFLYLGHRYGFQGTVALEDAGEVRLLQRVEVVSGLTFFGLYAWGVIDAIVHFRPHVAGRPLVTIAPIPMAGGVGLGLCWSQ